MREAPPRAKPLISIVDDDESCRIAITGLMKSLGFAAEAFSSAEAFLSSPRIRDTSCLIADVHMPGTTGIELHSRLIKSGHAVSTILVTAYPEENDKARALAAGVLCYLSKPLDEKALLDCITSALKRAKSRSSSASRPVHRKK
jgi:FixJ family two-component response regulator